MPSGVMRREQWQLLPIRDGEEKSAGFRSGVEDAYESPEGQPPEIGRPGKNGKRKTEKKKNNNTTTTTTKLTGIRARHIRGEFIEHELRGFAKSPVNLCAPYTPAAEARTHAKSFTAVVRTRGKRTGPKSALGIYSALF